MTPVELIIAGAGDRGSVYASYAKTHPKRAKVIGVAEPRDFYRERMVNEHNIPEENVFTDWKDMAKKQKFADAVIIATQDHMHKDPAIAFAKKKYVDGVRELDLHVIGKLRSDANMRYLYTGPKRETGSGRQKTYDGKVNWQDLSRFEYAGCDLCWAKRR